MIGTLKASQVRTNRAAFSEASMSRQPANWVGWLATMPTAAAVDATEADDDVHRALGLNLEELVVVQEATDHLVHVVRLVGRVRDQRVQLKVFLGEVVLDGARVRRRGQARGLGATVARQVAEQFLDVLQRVFFVGGDVVRDARLGHVGVGAAEILHGHVFAGDCLDHVRAGHEHLAGLVDHHGEVGQRGGVDVAACGRAHDQRDLRDHAGRLHVAVEDFGVQAERDDALLDARACALIDADQRATGLDGQIHYLADLLAVDLAEAAAEDGGVLAEDADLAAVDGAVAGDDAVAKRALLSRPKLVLRWRASASSSTKEPSSSRCVMRSRAVLRPFSA
jgi:hypothetical protein